MLRNHLLASANESRQCYLKQSQRQSQSSSNPIIMQCLSSCSGAYQALTPPPSSFPTRPIHQPSGLNHYRADTPHIKELRYFSDSILQLFLREFFFSSAKLYCALGISKCGQPCALVTRNSVYATI